MLWCVSWFILSLVKFIIEYRTVYAHMHSLEKKYNTQTHVYSAKTSTSSDQTKSGLLGGIHWLQLTQTNTLAHTRRRAEVKVRVHWHSLLARRGMNVIVVVIVSLYSCFVMTIISISKMWKTHKNLVEHNPKIEASKIRTEFAQNDLVFCSSAIRTAVMLDSGCDRLTN